ncbi:ATP-binding protein [Marinoscillum sp. 108]|uniref:DEAD/DEAH box helicase n=1 Tax=Marinoscillum sp. 108 TaxID=2653151 RepID=UPI0012F1A239|nr:AAA domain-containing protein [Marinoscillum sp. 108]VXD19763.1 ATP-dependent RecD-like DNA helicase [Marinoscillum sp. 108]
MSVLDDFKQAIVIQQQKDDEAYEEQIALPLDERVAKGVTMTNLKVIFDFYEEAPNQWCPHLNYPYKFLRSAEIFSDNNISKFREGAQVVLSNGSHEFKMDILEDTLERFVLAPNDYDVKACYLDSKSYNQNNWEINVVKTDLTLKLLSATAGNLESDSARLNKIERLFSGALTNPINSDKCYNGLNDSQNTAVTKAVLSPNFHLIQGPPGTGKTETIAHIAALYLRSGKKVFVTAPTHTAINNCLNAIANRVKEDSKVVKIGEKYQAAEILTNPHIKRKTRLSLESFESVNEMSKEGIVIGGTPYSLCYPASKRLNNWEFDVALIDEAAQMSIPLAVSVMSKTNKFVFVGDHEQLDPIMPSGTGVSMFSESVFRRLVRLYPNDKTLLNISYRLNDKLIRIPNKLFYSDQLTSGVSPNIENSQIPSNHYSEVLNNEDPKVLYLHKVFDSQGRSPHEASIVAGILKDLVEHGAELRDIGIITPYRAQVREIKKALNRVVKGIDTERTESLFIDTVDRMQGQERDYILYSMSNSHPLESKRRLDFFYSPNRLNVAITRGKKKCIVIANYKVFDIIDDELSDLPEYDNLKPSLNIFKEYFRLSTKIEEEVEEDSW